MDSNKTQIAASTLLTASVKMPSTIIDGTNGYTNVTWSTPAPTLTVGQSGQIKLTGDDADIVINGVSLVDKLDAIAERLNLLTINPELEEEWDQLRELGDCYRQLEQELKTKSAMWQTLKTKTPGKPRS